MRTFQEKKSNVFSGNDAKKHKTKRPKDVDDIDEIPRGNVVRLCRKLGTERGRSGKQTKEFIFLKVRKGHPGRGTRLDRADRVNVREPSAYFVDPIR